MKNASLEPRRPKQETKLPTSRDVALLAGVSQSSVCRVFDKKWSDRVSPALYERVMAAAKELGYSPNAIAHTLTARQSGIIGVIVSEDFNEFYYHLLSRITNELQTLNMRVMLFNAAPYRDINEVFDKLTAYRVDGIIVTAAAISNEAEPFSRALPIPLVLVNIYSKAPFCNSVLTDNYLGSKKMAGYLYDCGCRDFLYVSAEKSRYFDIPDRKAGFIDGLNAKGCTSCRLMAGDYSYRSGQEIAREIFSGGKRPDCIFSCGSRMAYGIMDTARFEFGLSIPDDVSVAAYEDTFASALDAYCLTSVQQPIDELAHAAISLLCRQLSGNTATVETMYTTPVLKIRRSVKDRTKPQ